jgi:hypothetical protein
MGSEYAGPGVRHQEGRLQVAGDTGRLMSISPQMRTALSTPEARDQVLLAFDATETGAVYALEQIKDEMSHVPKSVYELIDKHLADEKKHSGMVKDRMTALGIDPAGAQPYINRLVDLDKRLNPQGWVERYALIQILEEQVAQQYGLISDALWETDKISAELFASFAADERAHIGYCKAIDKLYGTAESREKLRVMRTIYQKDFDLNLIEAETAAQKFATDLGSTPSDRPLEVYERAKHFNMICGWGVPLDPAALGSGLVISGVCCAFVDRIGDTSVGYFYGMRANPELDTMERVTAFLRLRKAILQAAKDAGLTRGVTSTASLFVERGWNDVLGWERNGEYVLTGLL